MLINPAEKKEARKTVNQTNKNNRVHAKHLIAQTLQNPQKLPK
jgi:hypothetical protein